MEIVDKLIIGIADGDNKKPLLSVDERKKIIYLNALSGLINSYIGKKSYKRPDLN